MTPFTSHARTTVVFGAGESAGLGKRAAELGFRRSLLVADAGMTAAGYTPKALAALAASGVEVLHFDGFGENPDTAQAEAGRQLAAPFAPDSIIALGGGSSLDCGKAINFLLTNGGHMRDYQGYGKATRPMLPMLGVPTTTGTGSEAQSYGLVSDAETHVKMACGAPGAAFRLVILDPELAATQPRSVLPATGYDAFSHAVESFVTTRRNFGSRCYAREAFRLITASFERLLTHPGEVGAAASMQMGAYFAGLAIEHSMLGAAHATANPLTARFGITHGVAVALMLRHVVEFNMHHAAGLYAELDADVPDVCERLARAAGLPRTLRAAGVPESSLTQLAADASKQWTGNFNPRPFDEAAALEIYRCAY